MEHFRLAYKAEKLKLKGESIVWITFFVFAIAPIMGGIFILILEDPQAAEHARGLSVKAELMGFTANWASYLKILTQAMGVGGVLIFGFITSWIFGREHSEGTIKDLLSLPISRSNIINSKYAVFIVWGLALAISNLLIGIIIGLLSGLNSSPITELIPALIDYSTTTLLAIFIGIPVSFLALYGKGYLAPLGFVVIMIVFSQIIAASGYGSYFPWAVPGLHSGLANTVPIIGYVILFLTGITGYLGTIYYWNHFDQHS